MMLHNGKYDFIVVLKEAAVARRNEVYSLRCATCEYNLACGIGIDICTHLFACGFHQPGRFLRNREHPPVNVGLVGEIHIFYSLDNLARRLRRSGIVEIHQRLPINFTSQ